MSESEHCTLEDSEPDGNEGSTHGERDTVLHSGEAVGSGACSNDKITTQSVDWPVAQERHNTNGGRKRDVAQESSSAEIERVYLHEKEPSSPSRANRTRSEQPPPIRAATQQLCTASKQLVRAILHTISGRRILAPRGSFQAPLGSLSNDTYVRTIELTTLDPTQGTDVCFTVKAQFDTGCQFNLMAPRVFQKLGADCDDAGHIQIKGLGNGVCYPLGTIDLRWGAKDTSFEASSALQFAPKFYESKFYISNEDEDFDVVIGRDTINRYDLLTPKTRLALPGKGSYRLQPDVNSKDAKSLKENRKQERKKNKQEVEADKKRKEEERRKQLK